MIDRRYLLMLATKNIQKSQIAVTNRGGTASLKPKVDARVREGGEATRYFCIVGTVIC